jgi:hypothetical protein
MCKFIRFTELGADSQMEMAQTFETLVFHRHRSISLFDWQKNVFLSFPLCTLPLQPPYFFPAVTTFM